MTTAEILAEFRNLRVLVVGDVCLDRWCIYDPALADPSRETGLPRIAVVSTELTPGAAGTVASNVVALGARAAVLGPVGADGHGYELARALKARGIQDHHLVWADDISTFTYTKLINCRTGEEDLPRVDFVNTQVPAAELDAEIVRRLENVAPEHDVILVSDQAETVQGGAVTPAVREALARIACTRPQAVVWVDSRRRAELFRGVIVKANRQELEAASMRALGRFDYAQLRRHISAPLLVITAGAEGALVVEDRGTTAVLTKRISKPVDICGAGDSFSAGAALTLRVTGDPLTAVQFGNLVASITIMKKGTGTALPEEVLAAENHSI